MHKLLMIVLIAFSVPLAADPGDIHFVGTLQVEVKTGPSEESKTQFIIALGRKVVEFETRGEWLWVGIDRTGGKDGWVRKSDLSPTDPDGLRE